MPSAFLEYAPEVADALASQRPVVALESTILSHGMPYPQNLEMAQSVESIIREQGAVPATIALLHGKINIGLNDQDLAFLASHRGVRKVSRRDFAYVLQQKIPGATTVAATMMAAAQAGIRVFATGGIGGVHRGAETSMDISADLLELAQTPVAVVCAGAKSILDLPKTLEVLETHGVPVVGLQTHDFPAFYTRSSGSPVDFCLDSPEEVAAFLQVQWSLGLQGIVVANPVPTEFAMPEAEIQDAIDAALLLADQRGIRGKDITPFLLDAIQKHTAGASLRTNIALIKHNALMAARIAAAYHAIPLGIQVPHAISANFSLGDSLTPSDSTSQPLWIMIAGPYRSGTHTPEQRMQNLRRLNTAALAVFRKGHIPVLGVNLALPMIEVADIANYDEIMMPLSLALAARCDAVLRVGGPSTGADQEVDLIQKKGGTVFRHLDEIPKHTTLACERT